MSRVRAALAAALAVASASLPSPAHAADEATILGRPCAARIDEIGGERRVIVVGMPVFVGVIEGAKPGPANPTSAGCWIYQNGVELAHSYSAPGIGVAMPPPFEVKIQSQLLVEVTELVWAKLPDGTWIHRTIRTVLQGG